MNLVFRERGTVVVSLRSIYIDGIFRMNDIRETLDELELVLDLAALVGDLLLGATAGQIHCVV